MASTAPQNQSLNATMMGPPGVFGNKKLSANPNMNASLMQKIIQRDFQNDPNNSEINKMLATVLMQTTNFNEKYKDD